MMLLEELDTEFGKIRIIQSPSGICTYYQNGCSHSEADAEGISTCAYIHVLYSLITQSAAKRVLMIGCAGGTLATMLHRAGHQVTVVDINPHAFTLAKRYFHMPEEICCITHDGYAYLQNAPQHYDAIVVDVFSGDGQVPEVFTQPDFFCTARHVLAQDGSVLMNIIVPLDDMMANDIVHHMASAGLPTFLFDWTNGSDRNIIIAGGSHIANLQVDSDGPIPYHLKGLKGRKPQPYLRTRLGKLATI